MIAGRDSDSPGLPRRALIPVTWTPTGRSARRMSPADSEHEPQLTTEDDLQAIFIQKVIPHHGPITLADYNP
jgi:hypothetical protein